MAPKQRDSPPVAVAIDGAKLKQARYMAGLDQVPLAQRAGVSQSYISAIESGARTRVSASIYARICDALGVTDRTALMTDPPATAPAP